MSLHVLKPGLLVTLQDLGRLRYGKYGVITAGAMDHDALRVANWLVGNEEGAAALEITWSGFAVEFQTHMWISITGGNLSPIVDGAEVPMWRPILVTAGSVLSFEQPLSGCRAYLAVSGGFDIPMIMDSFSTYLRAGIGGFEGRQLKKGDVLDVLHPSRIPIHRTEVNSRGGSFFTVRWSVSSATYAAVNQEVTVRVVRGRQFDDFDVSSQQAWFLEPFRVTPQSDRMGYRLSGPIMQLTTPKEYVSEPVSLGTVQVPADGQPIILMADRQTLGGYPKIAQVASVDLPLIAQLPPGGTIRFQPITLAEAEALYMNYLQRSRLMETMIKLKWREW